MPLPEIIRELARIGFDGLEIAVNKGWTAYVDDLDKATRRDIRKQITDSGLELAALVSGHRNQVAPRAEFEAAQELYKRELELALDWATPGLIPVMDVAVGGKSEEWNQLKDLIVERVSETVAISAPKNIVVALEPHVGQAIDSVERMLWVIEKVNSPYCKVNFDISHLNVQGVPVEVSVPLMAPHTAHVHIKDELGIYPDHQYLIPGEGGFDYANYLTLMHANGYTGMISAEISLMVQRRPNYDTVAAMEQTYKVVSEAWARAGVPRG